MNDLYLLFSIAIRIDTVVNIFHRLLDHRDGVRTFRFGIDTFLADDRRDFFERRFQVLRSFFIGNLQFTFLEDLQGETSTDEHSEEREKTTHFETNLRLIVGVECTD